MLSHKIFFQSFFKKKLIFKSRPVITISRAAIITKFMLNKKFLVHSGKKLKKVVPTIHRLGTKFGEYSFTRKFPLHLRKKKKKR